MVNNLKILIKILESKAGMKLLSLLPSSLMYPGGPRNVDIELTNICNLKCALCPHNEMKRDQKFMDFEKYKQLIDDLGKYHFKPSLFLINWGESLLHPRVVEMINYANERGFQTSISSNLSIKFNKKKLKEIASSGLKKLVIDLDATDNKSYQKYRKGGDFNLVLENIRKIVKLKNKLNKSLKIEAQFLVMKHNQNQIEKAKTLAKSLGVDSLVFRPILLKTYFKQPEENFKKRLKEAKAFLPTENYSRYTNYEATILKFPYKICPAIKSATVLVNGDMVICCFDYEGRYILGNAFKENFLNIWAGKDYKKMRKTMIMKKLPLCESCDASNFKIEEITYK